MQIDDAIHPADLLPQINRVFALAAGKVRAIDRAWDPRKGSPVFTVKGKYTSRGWTEWTQGFQFGCPLLVFDGTDDEWFFMRGRRRTIKYMHPHVTHTGVHDHGFNTISTYGNLSRLVREKRVPYDGWEQLYYCTAIRASGAVQAARWSPTYDGTGFIYSFNGPHSLFVDSMRTLRVLGLAHQLGAVLMGENDEPISLLGRLIDHALTTAHYLVFKGDSDHIYDVRGRTAHEGVFNVNDGRFRCRATQQGYSPFSTWTRGLAWAMLGFAEQLEFLKALAAGQIKRAAGVAKGDLLNTFEEAARATCDHYVNGCAAADGVPYWDDGAPGLASLGDWRDKPADPFNDHEPVDSSAAAVAAQGLLRLGRYLGAAKGRTYTQAGLTIAATLMAEPYLAPQRRHQGLLLHSVYHRPNGWDHVPAGRKVPCGESSMWGDYHLLELAVYLQRLANGGPYLAFFDQG
jgi:unsaturated chondroitin disaccharide hydrolase